MGSEKRKGARTADPDSLFPVDLPLCFWCRSRDLNPDGSPHYPLKDIFEALKRGIGKRKGIGISI